MCFRDCTGNDGQCRIGAFSGHVFADEAIQPAGRKAVIGKGVGLEEFDEVLDGGSEITTNADFFEGDDHILPTLVSISSVGEDMSELRIGEFVQATGTIDGEVAPNVGARSEVQFLKTTSRRLEPGIGIFGSDTDCYDVSLGLGFALELG